MSLFPCFVAVLADLFFPVIVWTLSVFLFYLVKPSFIFRSLCMRNLRDAEPCTRQVGQFHFISMSAYISIVFRLFFIPHPPCSNFSSQCLVLSLTILVPRIGRCMDKFIPSPSVLCHPHKFFKRHPSPTFHVVNYSSMNNTNNN